MSMTNITLNLFVNYIKLPFIIFSTSSYIGYSISKKYLIKSSPYENFIKDLVYTPYTDFTKLKSYYVERQTDVIYHPNDLVYFLYKIVKGYILFLVNPIVFNQEKEYYIRRYEKMINEQLEKVENEVKVREIINENFKLNEEELGTEKKRENLKENLRKGKLFKSKSEEVKVYGIDEYINYKSIYNQNRLLNTHEKIYIINEKLTNRNNRVELNFITESNLNEDNIDFKNVNDSILNSSNNNKKSNNEYLISMNKIVDQLKESQEIKNDKEE